MNMKLTVTDLQTQNAVFQGSGAVSRENRCHGYIPAFLNQDTGEVYLSRDAAGNLSMIHQLVGLPASVILERDKQGRAIAVKGCVLSGFVLEGQFYSREECAKRMRVETRGTAVA